MAAFSNKFKQRTDVYEHGGQFLPLSVWEKKGFPIEVIEKGSRPEDVEPHDMFGKVYRVPVKYKGTKHEDVLQSGNNKRNEAATREEPAAMPKMLAPVAPGAFEAEHSEEEDSSEESVSSSSSSSSSEKKKKRKKKNKKLSGRPKKTRRSAKL